MLGALTKSWPLRRRVDGWRGVASGMNDMSIAGVPSAHVIVLGNEKGGSGKSTTAMNLIVALLKAGLRVASIDTDSRQRSLTRYVENRTRWAREAGLPLELPEHYLVRPGEGATVGEIEAREFNTYAEVIDRIEGAFDCIVVDTPASDSYLMRLSHSMADTLITPINDSFIDLDVLGQVDPRRLAVRKTSHYGAMVCEARDHRRRVDGKATDWIVVRNRLGTLASRNQRNVIGGLKALQASLGFRLADGISERTIFREFFSLGLTALDRLDRDLLAGEPTMSHLAARREVRELVEFLHLPPPLATGKASQSTFASPADARPLAMAK